MTAHRLNPKPPASYTVNLSMMLGLAYDTTHAVFMVPIPYGMSVTNAALDVSTVGLVDLVTATNKTNLSVASVGLYKTEGSHVMINVRIASADLTTNHPVRFSGTAPKVTLS